MKQFSFPVVKEVNIKNFSLYKKKYEINLVFDKDVFCLAGANGLGKSTFLSIVNYGLTGIVINPNSNFGSIVATDKFYQYNKKFAGEYFDGRVEENDRARASVTVKFEIETANYELTRDFFDPEELTHFTRLVKGEDTVEQTNLKRPLFDQYCEFVTQDIGLASFDQFVFLQHFVHTFDEHHNLLFWDPSLMETSLYLFFGVNVDDAQRANQLRKRINQLGSNIRNFTYQKGRTVRDVKELEEKIGVLKDASVVSSDVLKRYDELMEEQEANEIARLNLKHNIRFSELNISDYSIQLADLSARYQEVFNRLISPPIDVSTDARSLSLLNLIKEDVCQGIEESEHIEVLIKHIKANVCQIESRAEPELTERLKELDQSISHLKKEVEDAQKRKERLAKEIEDLDKAHLQLSKEVLDIEDQQGKFIKDLKRGGTDFTGLIESYHQQIEKLETEISKAKGDKVEKEKELKKLERQLNKGFADAEEIFIPIFQNHVSEFLGLDVVIRLQNSNKGTNLQLEINNTERANFHQLSESQRYFVDIGLRMALIEYGCKTGMLLIDTPEGSLDIAYESKAGKMFAQFGESKYKLLMTANINSSELLLQLAERCKNSGMNLERMTDWTFLSDVQQKENDKIERAFKEIESRLKA